MSLPFLCTLVSVIVDPQSYLRADINRCHQQNQTPIPNLAQYLAQKFRGKHVSNFYSLPALRIEMNSWQEFLYLCQNVTPNQGYSKLTSQQ